MMLRVGAREMGYRLHTLRRHGCLLPAGAEEHRRDNGRRRPQRDGGAPPPGATVPRQHEGIRRHLDARLAQTQRDVPYVLRPRRALRTKPEVRLEAVELLLRQLSVELNGNELTRASTIC